MFIKEINFNQNIYELINSYKTYVKKNKKIVVIVPIKTKSKRVKNKNFKKYVMFHYTK